VALDLGVPQANVVINYAVTKGSASLSSSSATTNGLGFASVTANLTNQNTTVQVSGCVAPSNTPCQIFTLYSTAPSLWTLETVAGASQAVSTGQSFQPLTVRVTDGSTAANPVIGVNVAFSTTLARASVGQGGGSLGGGSTMPVILGSYQAQVATDQNGLASIVPSGQNVGPCEVFIFVSAGASSAQFQLENLAAIVSGSPKSQGARVPPAPPNLYFSTASPTPTNSPEAVFAIPQGISSAQPCPEPRDAACPSSAPDASNPPESSSPNAPKDDNDPASRPDIGKQLQHRKSPKNEVPVRADSDPASVRRPDDQIKTTSSQWPPADKRSCRRLAEDALLF
jgi:hypothetical protein